MEKDRIVKGWRMNNEHMDDWNSLNLGADWLRFSGLIWECLLGVTLVTTKVCYHGAYDCTYCNLCKIFLYST